MSESSEEGVESDNSFDDSSSDFFSDSDSDSPPPLGASDTGDAHNLSSSSDPEDEQQLTDTSEGIQLDVVAAEDTPPNEPTLAAHRPSMLLTDSPLPPGDLSSIVLAPDIDTPTSTPTSMSLPIPTPTSGLQPSSRSASLHRLPNIASLPLSSLPPLSGDGTAPMSTRETRSMSVVTTPPGGALIGSGKRVGSWLLSSGSRPSEPESEPLATVPLTPNSRARVKKGSAKSGMATGGKHRVGRRIAKHRGGQKDDGSSSGPSAKLRKSRRSTSEKESQASSVGESLSGESLESSEVTVSQSPAPSGLSSSSAEPGGRVPRSDSFSTPDCQAPSQSPPPLLGPKPRPLLKRKSSSLTSMAIAREVIIADIKKNQPQTGFFSPQVSKTLPGCSSPIPTLAQTISHSSTSLLSARASPHSKLLLDPPFADKLFGIGKEQVVAPGAIIIKHRSENGYLFFITRGKIVETCQWGKSEKIVSTMGPSDTFGLLTCLLGIPSETNFISAEAQTAVLAVAWSAVLKMAKADPQFSHSLFKALAQLQASELQYIPFEAVYAFQKLSMASTQHGTSSPDLIPGHTLTERVSLQFRVQIKGKALLKRHCVLYFTENHLVVASKEGDSYPYVIDVSEIRSATKSGSNKLRLIVHNAYGPTDSQEKTIILYLKPGDVDVLIKRLAKRETDRNPLSRSQNQSDWQLSRQDTDLLWHNASQVRYRHGDPVLPQPITATDPHHVWMYLIVKGRLSLKHNDNGVTVGSTSQGEIFGEVPFLTGAQIFTGLTDSLDLLVRRIDSKKLLESLASNDDVAGRFYMHITQLLTARHREFLLKRIDALLGSDVHWYTFPRPDTMAIIEQVDADARIIRSGGSPEVNRLYLACEAGQLSLVQAILSRKPPLLMLNGSTDRNGWTCLHAALSEGHLDIAETLLRFPGIDVRTANKDDNLPIHFLARQKGTDDDAGIQLKVLDMMLQKGSSIYSRNRSGEFPIHLAAWKGNSVLVRALLKQQIHANLPNRRGETALHYSAVIGDIACAQILIEGGVDKWIANDSHQNALDFAMGGSKTGFVALFQDPTLDNDEALRQLLIATDAGKIDEVAQLLSQHTDAKTASSHPLGLLNTPVYADGMTLTHVAASKGHGSLLHMFFNSNDHTVDYGCITADGNTILHLLSRVSPRGSFETATYTNVLKRLNEKCSFVVNNLGELPFHVAVLHCSDLAVNYWLHHSYPLNYKTQKGFSVIDYAVIAGNTTVANHLAQSPQPKNLSTFALETAHRTNQEDLFVPWLKPKTAAPTSSSLISRLGISSDDLSSQTAGPSSPAPTTSDDGDLHLERFDRDPRKEFQVLHQIGQGACGAVLKARHKASGDLVAIKQIKASTQVQANLKNEIDILEGCQHENIVQYRGCFFMGGSEIWLVMQFCGVGALSSLLKTLSEPLSEPQISAILGGMLSGLGYLHRMGLVHRDLKPQNVLVDDSGEVKIADFGVSTQLGRDNDAEVGTPLYMSPEVLDGASYDARSDIWALGVTAIELAQGSPPHATEHMLKVMVLISEGPAPVLQNANRFSNEFNQFIDLCARKNPDERASIGDLLAHPFISRHQKDRMTILKALVDNFHAKKRLKEEEELRIERQKLLLPDVENFLQSLRTRNFDNNPKAFDAAMLKLNSFVNDLVELCRFVDEGKQQFVDKQAAEALILQIATSKQLLSSKRPANVLETAPSDSSGDISGESRKRKVEPTRNLRKPKALSDREWQDIAAKLAEVDTLRATTQQLAARVSSLETTIATLLQMTQFSPKSSAHPL